MRTIIAGSRGITDYRLVEVAANTCPWKITMVVSGTARGVDTLGERWALEHGLPVMRFPADWSTYGRSAGLRRNVTMADYSDALLALWDGESRGTAHMIECARERGLTIQVHTLP